MELRDRILKVLGQQGALSLRGLSKLIPNDPNLERELKTMVRRRLCSEPFTDSYELTDRGRKDYEALTPGARVPPHGRPDPTGLSGIPIYDRAFEYEDSDEDDEDDEECDGCGELVDDCVCDEEDDDDDDY
jgi:hypothetical protein